MNMSVEDQKTAAPVTINNIIHQTKPGRHPVLKFFEFIFWCIVGITCYGLLAANNPL